MALSFLSANDVKQAIMQWPGLYETETGFKFRGSPVSEVPTRLREAGWRNVSRLYEGDLERMGLKVVTARYVGGVHPKKFCRVVVAALYYDFRTNTPLIERDPGERYSQNYCN